MASGKDPFVNMADEKWKGLVILIGNDYKTCSGQRIILEGPLKDIERARRVFSAFGGKCIKVENKSAQETKKIIRDVASGKGVHPCYGWIVVLFSGHGEEHSILANDGKLIDIQLDIINPFQPANAPKIAKLPKLFFIDACRGSELTSPILIPKGSSKQEPRGGIGLDFVRFPPEGNMLIAFPTLPRRQAYESPGDGGIWINKVLNRVEKEDCSVTDVLQMVNRDILEHYQEKYDTKSGMQMAEYKSTLIGVFKFERSTILASPVSVDVQFTRELNCLKDSGRIIRRDYTDLPGPGNHVKLVVVLPNGQMVEFNSQKYSDSGFDDINTAREKVAEKAVQSIQQGRVQVVATKQIPRAVKNNEWLQELKNVLVDSKGLIISPENYETKTSAGNPPKFQCTFTHERFPLPISGEWRNSKKDAKQSVAEKVLEFFYANLQNEL